MRVVGRMLGETPRFCCLVFQVDEPQITATAIAFEIGLALHIHQITPDGRNLRIADPAELPKILGLVS